MRANSTRLFLAGWAVLVLLPAAPAAVAQSLADETPLTTGGKLRFHVLGVVGPDGFLKTAAYAAVFRKPSGPTTPRTWKRSLPPVVSGVSSARDCATAAGAAGSRTKTAQPARNNRVELALMPGVYAPRPAEDLPECLQSPSILSPPLRHRAQNLPEARIVTQWLGPRVGV